MYINKELAVRYAKKLLPHFHLDNYPAVFSASEVKGYEKQLVFIMDLKNSAYTREYESRTIRFLFSVKESLYQDLDSGLELDITADVNDFLDNYMTPGTTIHTSLD